MKEFFNNKNSLIFLCFLFISFLFWLIISLNKTNETRLVLPIEYRNVPRDIAITADLPASIEVKLEDKGTTLLRYIRKEFPPLVIDLKEHKLKKNKRLIIKTNNKFEREITALLKPSTIILAYHPLEIIIEKVDLASKMVKVKLNTQLDFAQQYHYSDSITIQPKEIKLFGRKEDLDSINTIDTQLMIRNNLSDTTITSVKLDIPAHTKAQPSEIKVTIPTEKFTEGSRTVPVLVKNLPRQLKARTFPSEIKVSYLVGISNYNKIKESDFVIYIDYNDIIKSDTKEQFLSIGQTPSEIINYKLEPADVQWLLEVTE